MFITAMNLDGYNLYGKTFLDKAKECLPGPLTVYSEDSLPVEHVDLNRCEAMNWFLQSAKDFPAMCGMMNDKYVYRFDVHKFCRKSFAQLEHYIEHSNETFWWIDADVEFKQPIPINLFEQATKGVFMAYQGRPDWHSCASMVGFNNTHPQSSAFWISYLDLYMSGKIFVLPEWHDSYLLDFLRENLQLMSRDMAEFISLGKGPVNVFDEIWGRYAHHKKGNLKHERGPQRYQQLINIVKSVQPRRVVEVGTWNGDRALEMFNACPGMHYVGLDLFESATDETDAKEKNVKPHFTSEQVGEKLKHKNYELFGGDSKQTFPAVLEKFGENAADIVFIDGGHSVETIKSDLDVALKITKPGGIIILDDYYTDMEGIDKFGCNSVLEGMEYELLPIADPVKGGGFTQMAVIRVL